MKVQANEIHQKDMEIERLQKLLTKSKVPKKENNSQAIDILLQSVEQKSTEMKTEEEKEWTLLTKKNIIV